MSSKLFYLNTLFHAYRKLIHLMNHIGFFLFHSDYVTLIKQAVYERRSVECPSYRWAADDIAVLNRDIPRPLTHNFEHFEKAALIRRHSSRFIQS